LKIHAKAWKDGLFGRYHITLSRERSIKTMTNLHHWITIRHVVLYLNNHCFKFVWIFPNIDAGISFSPPNLACFDWEIISTENFKKLLSAVLLVSVKLR
jgi:hypothetical protein